MRVRAPHVARPSSTRRPSSRPSTAGSLRSLLPSRWLPSRAPRPLYALGLVLPLVVAVAGGAHPTTPEAVYAERLVAEPERYARLDLLAINDLHGALEPAPVTDATGEVQGEAAGGAAYLATHLDLLRAESRADGAVPQTVAAGDLIGGSPLVSAAAWDEPTIDVVGELGVDVSALGNHELDHGVRELRRLIDGGCRPAGESTRSCPLPDRPFTGADFDYLAANVTDREGRPLLPAYAIREVDGVPVAYVGLVLADTPSVLAQPAPGLRFADETATMRRVVDELADRDVHAVVALLHEGATALGDDPNTCLGLDGPAADLARTMPAEVDAIVSAHSHEAYTCTVDDPAGDPRVLTSAASTGRVVTRLRLLLDRGTGDVVRDSVVADNVVVTRDVEPDPDVEALVQRYADAVAPLGARAVGTVPGGPESLTREDEGVGRGSAVGRLVADAMRTGHGTGTPVDVALVNPGGLRADLAPGPATYADLFAVLPFRHRVTTLDLTGADLVDALDQQWSEHGAEHLSASGIAYETDGDAVRAGSVTVGDAALDPERVYRVAVPAFLATGGDGFTALTRGTDVRAGRIDTEAVEAYLAGL